tara:strand:+ start:100 stop:699 length:600 start_codon:yes stop_codon:yes gene_type:complete
MAKKKPDNHYIDNEEFYQAMIEWKKVVKEAEEAGEGKPPVTDYIGECFMKIAEHLSYRPNFINYPFREEMVGDGIENCLMYCTNFDPEKSKNPFSYFTQIIYYAFLRRIQKEKKQTFIKYKAIQVAMDRGLINQANMGMHFFDPDDASDPVARYLELSENDIEKFDKTKKKKKETKPKPVTDEPFDPFMETTDEDSDSK